MENRGIQNNLMTFQDGDGKEEEEEGKQEEKTERKKGRNR